MQDLLLRWCLGDTDTTTRTEMSDQKFTKFVQMTKLSIYSFQRFFDADFLLCFNGSNWNRFDKTWNETLPMLPKTITILNQQMCENPYPTFFPLGGVWWKWVPFRYDERKTEISIDTDIICVSEPLSWKKWLQSNFLLLIPFEAIQEICEATCGDVWKHPILNEKRAYNCGIIGQKKNIDVSEQFFKLSELVDYGSYNGNFVTEQGLFNILYRSLELDGISHSVLPYEQNFQARHLLYYLSRGEKIETIHFTAKSKLIFYDLYDHFRKRVDQEISNLQLLSALNEWCVLNKSLVGN